MTENQRKRAKAVRFKNKIKQLRFENGISQRGLAKKIGVSQNAVRRWEDGFCTPNVENLRKLVAFFGVEAEQLIYFEF